MASSKDGITRISLLKVNQLVNETCMFTGVFPARLLIESAKVPRYSPDDGRFGGYQRTESQRRVDQIRDLILQGESSGKLNFDAFMSAVSINIRSEDARASMERPRYTDENFDNDLMWTFKYTSKFADDIFIVDGQHRLLGLKAAYDLLRQRGDHRSEIIGDFRVPALVTFAEDEHNEALQFYLINEKQKKVSTDGAQRLLIQGYKQGHQRFREVIKDVAKVQCGVAVDRLAEESELWSRHLKDFNETGKQKVSRSSFADQSKRMHAALLKKRDDDEETANELFVKIVDAFYTGLLSLKGFDAITNPGTAHEYALFKSSQTAILQRVLTYFVLVWDDPRYGLWAKFGDMTDSSVWKELLRPLEQHKDQSKGGGRRPVVVPEPVVGVACWREGRRGAMGKYTSQSAIQAKAAAIVDEIEEEHGINPRTTV